MFGGSIRFVLLAVGLSSVLMVGGCGGARPQVQLKEVLKQQGGIDKINREAIAMFDYFATNRGDRFHPYWQVEEKLNCPVLRSLSRGYGIFVERDVFGTPECIRVPYGTHQTQSITLSTHLPGPTNSKCLPLAFKLCQTSSLQSPQIESPTSTRAAADRRAVVSPAHPRPA